MVTLRSARWTLPERVGTTPAIASSKVVFPDPAGPMTPQLARRRNAERHVAELELSQSGGQLPDVDHVGAGPVRSYRNARRTVSGMSASTAITPATGSASASPNVVAVIDTEDADDLGIVGRMTIAMNSLGPRPHND